MNFIDDFRIYFVMKIKIYEFAMFLICPFSYKRDFTVHAI